MTAPSPLISNYRHAVRLIDAQRKILADAGGAPEIVDAYTQIVRHLNKISPTEINRVMGAKSLPRTKEPSLSPEVVRRLKQPALEALIFDSETSRKHLEAVAVYRFGVPKGSMRSFPNIAALREKLRTLVENERSHEIITSIANRSVNYTGT